METNLEFFNRLEEKSQTAEEMADDMVQFKIDSGEITPHTDVKGLREAIIEWLNSPKPERKSDGTT